MKRMARLARDGKVAFSTVHLDESSQHIPKSDIVAIIKTAKSFSDADVQVELLGNAIQGATEARPSSSEGIALLAAAAFSS
ncbi:MAG: hypothetical protein WDO06_05605 [Actinomycetota bacterium]